jgi:hypothetical protein
VDVTSRGKGLSVVFAGLGLNFVYVYQVLQEIRKGLGQVLFYRQVQVYPRYLLDLRYIIPYFTRLVELDNIRAFCSTCAD